MVRRVLEVLKVLGVLGVLAVLGVRAEGPPSLVGTWTLTTVERAGDNGTWTPQPLPRGTLIFDGAGHAFELAETGRRTPYASAQATATEARAVYNNYSGFWGTYKVDTAQQRITYHPDGAISPNAMGQDVVRTFTQTGDRLVVTATADEPDGLGGTRWTWERVPQLETLSAANRKLLGFWRHVVEKRINLTTGAVQSETERAPSVIVYSASGFVGVHFPPMNRPRFAAAQPTDDEARSAIAGFVSYYGAYTTAPGIVFHHRMIILGTAPADTLKRFYEINGDTLTLRFPPGRNQQGQEIRTEVTLKRISGADAMLLK
jgi:hypothetical protein